MLLSPGRVFHYNTKELYAWQCQENRKALTENLVIGQAIRAVQEGEKNGYGHAAMSHWQAFTIECINEREEAKREAEPLLFLKSKERGMSGKIDLAWHSQTVCSRLH